MNNPHLGSAYYYIVSFAFVLLVFIFCTVIFVLCLNLDYVKLYFPYTDLMAFCSVVFPFLCSYFLSMTFQFFVLLCYLFLKCLLSF
ncbi:hypothetical protein CW304_32795 [Bacillus sp. UFRGS-B20]|nr:hypothetical protein CW304_32795 [Bacillus sp. UFRGS-B20]